MVRDLKDYACAELSSYHQLSEVLMYSYYRLSYWNFLKYCKIQVVGLMMNNYVQRYFNIPRAQSIALLYTGKREL